MAISQDHLDAVVVAVLAVNNYPLEKAWALLPRLRQAGLTDPRLVASEDLGSLTVGLARAGYNRGLLTAMMAERLQGLGQAVQDGTLSSFDAILAQGDRERAISVLRHVRGIGPRVAANAWTLLRG